MARGLEGGQQGIPGSLILPNVLDEGGNGKIIQVGEGFQDVMDLFENNGVDFFSSRLEERGLGTKRRLVGRTLPGPRVGHSGQRRPWFRP